jgi:ribosomal protein L37E
MKKKVINLLFPFLLSLTFLILAIGSGSSSSNKKSKSNSSSSPSTKKSDSYKSTTPSFTCKNCGGHSFHYHETLTNMEVCNSCGMGN